jgi:hypothetical protein
MDVHLCALLAVSPALAVAAGSPVNCSALELSSPARIVRVSFASHTLVLAIRTAEGGKEGGWGRAHRLCC